MLASVWEVRFYYRFFVFKAVCMYDLIFEDLEPNPVYMMVSVCYSLN